MAYEKTNWTSTTPINTTNLNNIEDGISEMPQTIQPIGSVYITSTNENPSSYLGGTWELIDKEYASIYGSNKDTYWTSNDNATLNSIYIIRGGHSITIGMNIIANVNLSDTTVTLGTLNFEELGITNTIFSKRMIALSDDGNTTLMAGLHYTSGAVTITDVFNDNHSFPSGTAFSLHFELVAHKNYMVDSKCNKFYWKRTS